MSDMDDGAYDHDLADDDPEGVCGECGLPDLTVTGRTGRTESYRCDACGFAGVRAAEAG